MERANKIMAGIGFGYGAAFTLLLFLAMARWGIEASPSDLSPAALVVLVVSGMPGLVGLAGRKGPFVFSFVLTVLPTLAILVMVIRADSSLGAVCSLILFLAPALAISLLASIISGIYLLVRFIVNRKKAGKDD